MRVQQIPYEIIEDGIAIAEAMYAKHDEARKAQFEIAKSLGASGFRPSRSGGIASLLFEALPDGFRRTGNSEGKIEAVPALNTKAGKAAKAAMAEAPTAINTDVLAEEFGWNGEWAIVGDGRVYFASATRLMLPSPRYFITVPRQPNDGVVMADTVRELLQSEYAAAFEDHNAAVRELKPEEAA